jgi:carboxymethylenebutenolidase
MNIFRPSTYRWRSKLAHPPSAACGLALNRKRNLLLAAAALLIVPLLVPAQDPGKLPPFLKDFLVKDPPILVTEVKIASAIGPVAGYVGRPDTQEKLPAILLIHDEDGLTNWIKLNAREISTIGYVVLAVDLRHRLKPQDGQEEKILAELSAAVRWLRRRPDVFPERIGVVGGSWGGSQALALASATPLQACVLCDGPLSVEPALMAGLRDTAVLGIFSEPSKVRGKEIAGFRAALTAANIPHRIQIFPGTGLHFMGPPSRKEHVEVHAEQAWFEIYEFLGKHVEDAGLPREKTVAAKEKSLATIADIMQAVNQPTGVRGRLIEVLKEKPADDKQWKRVRANAALIAEAGHWLEGLRPKKGSERHWREQARTFRQTASQIVVAADGRDYEAARLALEQLGKQCAACHRQHS